MHPRLHLPATSHPTEMSAAGHLDFVAPASSGAPSDYVEDAAEADVAEPTAVAESGNASCAAGAVSAHPAIPAASLDTLPKALQDDSVQLIEYDGSPALQDQATAHMTADALAVSLAQDEDSLSQSNRQDQLDMASSDDSSAMLLPTPAVDLAAMHTQLLDESEGVCSHAEPLPGHEPVTMPATASATAEAEESVRQPSQPPLVGSPDPTASSFLPACAATCSIGTTSRALEPPAADDNLALPATCVPAPHFETALLRLTNDAGCQAPESALSNAVQLASAHAVGSCSSLTTSTRDHDDEEAEMAAAAAQAAGTDDNQPEALRTVLISSCANISSYAKDAGSPTEPGVDTADRVAAHLISAQVLSSRGPLAMGDCEGEGAEDMGRLAAELAAIMAFAT